MNKKLLKWIVSILAFIPFCFELPSLFPLWKKDPVDVVYMFLAALVCAFLIWRRYKEAVSTDVRGALVPMLCCLGVMIYGYQHDENSHAICYIGTILFAWSVVWMAFGWRMFYRLFPVPLLMLLGLPRYEYLYFFPGITILWKVAIACALCIYALFALLTDFNPIRRRTALFALGIIIYALLYASLPENGETYDGRYKRMISMAGSHTHGI